MEWHSVADIAASDRNLVVHASDSSNLRRSKLAICVSLLGRFWNAIFLLLMFRQE